MKISDDFDLHPLLLEDLKRVHEELRANGELHSPEALQGFYAAFRQRFGPEVLQAHDGESLLALMHETTPDGMVYWLEFKNDDEFPATFGGIKGGSALKYGLYRRRETGEWTTGSVKKQRTITTQEAVALAHRNRDQLVAASGLLAAFPTGSSPEAYAKLQEDLARVAPDVQDSSWGHKYLALIHRDKLDDYHALSFQRFHLVKLLQEPSTTEGEVRQRLSLYGFGRCASVADESRLDSAESTKRTTVFLLAHRDARWRRRPEPLGSHAARVDRRGGLAGARGLDCRGGDRRIQGHCPGASRPSVSCGAPCDRASGATTATLLQGRG